MLRFYPDPAVGFEYPEMYLRLFGEDFRPEPYIEEEYRRIKDHKWYMTSRLITINDIYSFDPNAKVEMEEFEDIIGRSPAMMGLFETLPQVSASSSTVQRLV